MTTRIRELDALRGFAICGIMLVNTWQHSPKPPEIDWAMNQFVQGRFYPIFSFLFGMSFALFLRAHPDRLIMGRRLAVLALFGAAHWVVNPGEVLVPYAIFGAVALVPASFLPKLVQLPLGVAVTTGAVVYGDPWILIAGLFLLGLAAVEFDAIRPNALFFALSVVLAVVLTWADVSYLAACLAGAAAYASGFMLISPRVFEPLGKLALTAYLSSTVVILLVRPATAAGIIAVTVVTLVVQWLFARLWLTRFRYGPLEWIWRCLTWWELVPNGQTQARDPRNVVPDLHRSRPKEQPGVGS
ncbi:membrane protein [Acrocarpospora pleiomorpha]|uniref:Membrane protein n=1 Tax=Acrocarpospora pleiomorpha TaxID=90975 RepID=A0A5M3XZ14_9ACTN|nr:DUF418 domain-containing protein [Acrocarpospora pleiomorpha]GES26365.1 membrane protein [Acrocarpospora pleiomorpha]